MHKRSLDDMLSAEVAEQQDDDEYPADREVDNDALHVSPGGEEEQEGDHLIDCYQDGTPVERDSRGRIVPRVHSLATVPKHEADRGFAPVRFVRKYTMPDNVLTVLQTKAANAVRENSNLQSGRSVALIVNRDAWQLALDYVDTMSLRAFALGCATFAVLARAVLSTRLTKHPFITSPIHLSTMQYHAFAEAVYRRQNLFITGEAGSGKTVLLRTIVDTLRRTDAETGEVHSYEYFAEIESLRMQGYDSAQKPKLATHNRKRFLNVLVIAPTGTAAEVCGGQTSASVLGNPPIEVVTDWESYRSPVRRGDPERVIEADVVVWDEISMVSRQGLEHAERVVRQFKRKPRTLFGGLQTIFFGDFAQLPPVSKGSGHPQLAQRCFLSPVWRQLFGDPFSIDSKRMILLPCSMRQGAHHAHFIKCLRELRCGQASSTVSTLLNERWWERLKQRNDPCMRMPCVVIASTNTSVDEINNGKLNELINKHKAREIFYTSWLNRVRAAEYNDASAPATFRMVVGSRVSLTRNALFYHLSNGSMGEVVDAVDLTDPAVLTRIKKGDLRFLSNINYSIRERVSGELSVSVSPFLSNAHSYTYPVVEFYSQPSKFYVIGYWSTPIGITREEEKKNGELKRFEVPLRVAFAQTTHRWQGGTIPEDLAARVQLQDAFSPELIYVALSRVRSPNQLIITTQLEYGRFYGTGARHTICPETIRFLRVQDLRLENLLLQREALETERRLLEKKRSRSSDARTERAVVPRSETHNQPNLDI